MDRKSILSELGRRLRDSRRQAGLTLTELSARAGVSRRYATEAEAGRANLSVLKLMRLARATGVSLAELFALPLQTRKGERIALLGVRGAGKSTVGRALALKREVPFVELDERVEQVAGMNLGTLFDLQGEDSYHRLEQEALERALSEGDRLVLATGGSIVARTKTFERLREACRTVWLIADPEDHFRRVLEQGDRRPTFERPRAKAELAAILAERKPLYGQCDIAIQTSGRTVDEVVEELSAKLDEEAV
jgi:XRE family aerobic/anaerobic benzoate catabolism transcriptional regulator